MRAEGGTTVEERPVEERLFISSELVVMYIYFFSLRFFFFFNSAETPLPDRGLRGSCWSSVFSGLWSKRGGDWTDDGVPGFYLLVHLTW